MGFIARSIELSLALHEAMRIIQTYDNSSKPSVAFEPKGGDAHETEAPRGMLIHRYELDDAGYVKNCTLIPPTSQNLAQMEIDLRDFIQNHLDKPLEFLKKGKRKDRQKLRPVYLMLRSPRGSRRKRTKALRGKKKADLIFILRESPSVRTLGSNDLRDCSPQNVE